ncbi:MAG: UbiA-like polyprenyltransferase [Gemmatimonadota bacterium]
MNRAGGSPDGQVLPGESLAIRYLNFVKLPHTLFALPFALLGLVAASRQGPVTPRLVGLAVLAFTSARWVGLGFNMISDRYWDQLNPRNQRRELPRGALTLHQAWLSVLIAAAIFLVTAAAINRLCGILAPVALVWVMTYSYAKRFTNWPHLWLGMSLAIAPVGGWLAIAGHWSDPWWALLSVTVGVATWVAGFDIFYALPDEAFDRLHGLHSVVARFGVRQSIVIARILHGITIPALAAFGAGVGFGGWYFTGVAAAALILLCEHSLVRADDLSLLGAAFFTMNAVMSSTLFGFALLDRLTH